jgi:aminoglycoside phosphotransferase (APT) family kinase protein
MEEGWLFDAPAEFRSRVWLGGLHAMASLQRVPPSTFAFLDRPDVGDGFAQEWDRWERFSDTLQGRRRIPFLEAARRRLHETLPDNRPAGLVWGDARLGNIMFDHEGEVVALMDWEQPSLGGALQDLGWWLFNDRAKVHARGGTILEGIGGRDETIAIWEASTGLSAAEVDWYEQFAGFKMVCLLVNMMDMRGETPPSGDYADIWNARVAGPLLGLRPGDW